MKGLRAACIVLAGSVVACPISAATYEYFSTNMFGNLVPSGGHDVGMGEFSAEAELDDGELCYFLDVQRIDDPGEAHIHEASNTESGPAVVTLTVSSADICQTVDAALLRRIVAKPDDFYVDVHTEEFPEAAIRGQLHS
jgi:hypothetical protein